MKRSNWLNGLRKGLTSSSIYRAQARRRPVTASRRSTFEVLEDRRLLAMLTVNSALDNNTPGDGLVTLREAIIAANANSTTDLGQTGSGADTIQFDSAAFAAPQILAIVFGQMVISESLTINGPGRDVLTIDAQNNFRIFNFTAQTGDFTIADLALTRGRVAGSSDEGGAINKVGSGHLKLERVDITASTAFSPGQLGLARGGAVFVGGGTLTVISSFLSGNQAMGNSAWGGAIASRGRIVNVIDSTIANNIAMGTQSGQGGGIYVRYDSPGNMPPELTLTGTTISGNVAVSAGGGIYIGGGVVVGGTIFDNRTTGGGTVNYGGGGVFGAFDLQKITIHGNSSATTGGGIKSIGGGATIDSSTVSNNTSESGGGGIYSRGAILLTNSTVSGNVTRGEGGGISATNYITLTHSTVTDNESSESNSGGVLSSGNDVRAFSSIIAGNRAFTTHPDIRSGADTYIFDYTIIGDAVGTSLIEAQTPDARGNLIGSSAGSGVIDPKLAPLADNGGPTKTHALLFDSAAIDANLFPAFPVPARDYPLNGSLADELGGPSLTALGGNVGTASYGFSSNRGLNASTALANPSNYTLELNFNWTNLSGSWQKIVDFHNLTSNVGLYTAGNGLHFVNGPFVANVFTQNEFARLVLTRDDTTDTVRAYLDGVEIWSFIDAAGDAVFDGPSQIMRFFQDDTVTGQIETGGGRLDSIRIYNAALTPAQVSMLPDPFVVPQFDQRGTPFARKRDGDGIGGSQIDIGAYEAQEVVLPPQIDYGDAPDTSAGTGPGNYNTLVTDNGPSHTIVAGLHLGAKVDSDDGRLQNAAANADDVDGALPDDEDGVSNPATNLVLTVGANQSAGGFTLFDAPGQAYILPRGINDLGQIVGSSADSRGFLKDGANVTPVAPSGMIGIRPGAINNAGVIVGSNVAGVESRGFLKNGINFTHFDVPGARTTFASGINNLGQIVGVYRVTGDPHDKGFLKDGDAYTLFNAPFPGTFAAEAQGINNLGDVVGFFSDNTNNNGHGFVKSGSTYTQFDVPFATTGTRPTGINDSGQIVGVYFGGPAHGFLKNGAIYTSIDVPGATDTFPEDINNSGQIVGYYTIGASYIGGFVYTLPSPGPSVSLRATNTTGAPATLFGWIDYNADGVFDNATERASVPVPAGTNNGVVAITFPTVPPGFVGTTYARFRLSTDTAAANPTGPAADGEVEDYRVTIFAPSDGVADSTKNKKIASDTGGGPVLANGDKFGSAVASIGDLDGDGVEDLAVGAPSQYGVPSTGAVHVLFMHANGTVKASQRIGSGIGGGPAIANGDYFGHSVAAIGDLDGDGVTDLAVGASKDDTGAYINGAVYILFMNSNGTAKSSQKIASATGGGPTLINSDRFGSAVTSIGDLDGDGVGDVAVGAVGDDTGGSYRGAVHILFLNPNGTVKSGQRIASGVGGGPALANLDFFGGAAANLGDLDGDGVTELAVGASGEDTGGNGRGAVHVLFLNANGTVKSSQKIASGAGGGLVLADGDAFGRSAAGLGDLDGDGVNDLVVGAYRDGTGGPGRGALHVLFLNDNGTVKSSQKIASGIGGGPTLANGDGFGSGVTRVGDLDGDGAIDLAVGSETDDTGGDSRGAVHVLFLTKRNTSPVITSPTTVSVPENSAAVMTVAATDAEVPPQTVTFSIAGGVDQSKFNITAGGSLLFNTPPDFETPADANGDNVYIVIVRASDGSLSDLEAIVVTVTPVNDHSPVFTSPAAITVTESTTTVVNISATDADLPSQVVAYSIVGGADQARFNITGGSVLAFNSPPSFEAPTDANGDNVYELIVQANDGNGRTTTQAIQVMVTSLSDFGDAPDAAPGNARGNYGTRAADNGPRHTIVPGLRLGANVDRDDGTLQNTAANADDVHSALPDDEDGVSNPMADLVFTAGAQPTVTLRASNTTGTSASLYGWIDYNADGVFDNATERAAIAVPGGSNNGIFTLIFPTIPAGYHGTTYARFRLSTDAAAANPTGWAASGEVEDYQARILNRSALVADSSKTHQLTSGSGNISGLEHDDNFGVSVASIGDVDGDGVIDLAVGAYRGNHEGNSGAVHVLLMNPNGTVRQSREIIPPLNPANGELFGRSVAGIGDLNGDGVPDIAVGERRHFIGNQPGGVHIIFLNPDGTVRGRQLIDRAVGGGPNLGDQDNFGIAITSLGDLDGDGVSDIAVGANGDSAIHILFMNTSGTAKSTRKITNGDANFGSAVSSLGDIDGDGITDLAVVSSQVSICFLNSDGTIKSQQRVGPYGGDVAALGDVDGDGIRDLVAGNGFDNASDPRESRGTVNLLLLNSDGTVKKQQKIGHLTGGGPELSLRSHFGRAVTAIPDLDGDGITDLAVGTSRYSLGDNAGSVYILFLKPFNSNPSITSPASAAVPENTSAVMTVTVTDIDSPRPAFTFSIGGGPDQSRFNITSGGVLSFNAPPDFDAPADANGDNVYVVTVAVSDGNGGFATQTISVTVTPVNDNSPLFTSPDMVNVSENTTTVLTVMATDADLPPPAVAYSIVGGADQSKFLISSGGALAFKSPPDFEAPNDSNGDNVYVVIVQASDGSLTNLQAILVTVTNIINEPPIIGDYNRNGTVEAADYVLWRNSLGQIVTPFSGADGSGNGAVDQDDYLLWRGNFGRTAPASSSATAAIEIEALIAAATSDMPLGTPGNDLIARRGASSGTIHRSGRPCFDGVHPATRSSFTEAASHDHALVAWLSANAAATQRKLSGFSFGDRLSETDHRESTSAEFDALDLVFASLGAKHRRSPPSGLD